jgi:NAD(P)-dependent dehydrogenase (short-subunit alcohol dehydrogenase family)
MTGRLAGRVGVITGGGGGIGRAGAVRFAAEGAALVLLDPDEDGTGRTVADIEAAGGTALALGGDCAAEADVRAAVRAAVDTWGKLDLLWANAGIGVSKTVPETTLAEWERVVAVNLTGAFLLAKYGIPELTRAGGGTMVISGSANSFTADRRWAAYCATKGALLMFCKALALDHAGDGVRVNIVCPGSVTTPLHELWLREHAESGAYDDALAADTAAHPLGRLGTPRDVANAALFLSCDESSFITGTSLAVDGGVTA